MALINKTLSFDMLTEIASVEEQFDNVNIARSDLGKMLYSDAELSAAAMTRLDSLQSQPFVFDNVDGSPLAKHVVDIVTKEYRKLAHLRWTSLLYGYSVGMIKWDTTDIGRPRNDGTKARVLNEDGIYTFNGVEERPIQNYEPQLDGSLRAFNNSTIELDTDHKFLVTVNNQTANNVLGISLLALCYQDWYDVQNLRMLEMSGLEQYSESLVVGQVESPSKFKTAMENLGIRHFLAIGREDKVTSVSNVKQADFSTAHKERIAAYNRVFTGGTLTTISNSTGSFGQASFHDAQFQAKVKNDNNGMEDMISGLIEMVYRVNGKDFNTAPKIIVGNFRSVDKQRLETDERVIGLRDAYSDSYIKSTYKFKQEDFK